MAAVATGDSKTIDLGGEVHYTAFGGSGREMLLVHGLGGSSENWLAVGPQLAERFRVRALDLAGFGRTPLTEARSTTVLANRELLDRFIREVVGPPVVLVGNSMGGLLSILQAAAEPEMVSALILVDPAVPSPPGVESDPMVEAVFATYLMDNAEELVRNYVRAMGPDQTVLTTMQLCCVDVERVDPQVLQAHIALAGERAGMEWSARAQVEAARSILELRANEDRFEDAVREIQAPTLLIQGEKDRLIPLAAAEALAKARTDWAFEIFEDIGHIPQLEAPDLFVKTVLDWLNAVLVE